MANNQDAEVAQRQEATGLDMNKEDHREYSRNHYENNKEVYKLKGAVARKRTRERAQEYLLDYFNNHPCVDCGESDILVLQFDHVKGKTSNIHTGLSLFKIKQELELCEIRCANCHMRRHLTENDSWRIV